MTYEEDGDREGYPPHQLVPVRGGRYTTVLKGPEGTDVGDLFCDLEPYVDYGKALIVTHNGWAASEEQASQLACGAHIRVSVWQHPIPPLAVSVEAPLCGCHEESMVWEIDSDDDDDPGGYVCCHLAGALEDAMRDAHVEQDAAEAADDTALGQAKQDFRSQAPEEPQEGD